MKNPLRSDQDVAGEKSPGYSMPKILPLWVVATQPLV